MNLLYKESDFFYGGWGGGGGTRASDFFYKETPVTLTFNLPTKIFQMALLLLKGNDCAKLI